MGNRADVLPDQDGPVRFLVCHRFEEEKAEGALDDVAENGLELPVERVGEEPEAAQAVLVDLAHGEEPGRGIPEDEWVRSFTRRGARGVLGGQGGDGCDREKKNRDLLHRTI